MKNKKQKWLKGWKVITKIKRMSCFYRQYDRKKSHVTYPKDTVVGRPRGCGPLAVFLTKKLARSFLSDLNISHAKSSGGYEYEHIIVSCLYLPSKHNRLWSSRCSSLYKGYAPKGSEFAEKVKCLE